MLGLLTFVLTTLLVAALLQVGWLVLILATGGSFWECDRGDCGTLGEFGARLGWFVPLAALAIGGAVAWALTPRRRGRAQ